MNAKLTAKETALLTAIAENKFTFFDDGLTEGGNPRVQAVPERLQHRDRGPRADPGVQADPRRLTSYPSSGVAITLELGYRSIYHTHHVKGTYSVSQS